MANNTHVPAEQLATDIADGVIDTVIVAFGDHQGRLVGKRTDGDFYLDVVAALGTENCDYLIACDLDNTPIPGLRWASYDQGYGDMRGVVDPTTIRYLPWLEATAVVLVDLLDVDTDEPVTVSPRRILQAQVEAAAALGCTSKIGSEVEFFLFTHLVFKNAVKEIAALHGRSATFMAKPHFDDAGSSGHIHSSLWSADGAESRVPGEDEHHLSDEFRWYLGGLMATARDFSLLFAPNVNSYKRFLPGSWAPTGIGWDTDNRTLGFRLVGHGAGTRIESRIPGADANPYHAFAATIAGGLHGIRERIEPPVPYHGNGYTATDLPRIPGTFVEAIELWRASEVARAAFGDDVHHHVLTHAVFEWATFNATVTDWERRRYFERI